MSTISSTGDHVYVNGVPTAAGGYSTTWPYNIPASAGGTTTISYPYTIPADAFPSKEDYIKKYLWEVESSDRLMLLLEKVKNKKLTPTEALAFLKGDKSIKIDG